MLSCTGTLPGPEKNEYVSAGGTWCRPLPPGLLTKTKICVEFLQCATQGGPVSGSMLPPKVSQSLLHVRTKTELSFLLKLYTSSVNKC